jgi:hypothetical protein
MRGSTRQHERVTASIPVAIEGGLKGETVNVSPTGVYFVTDGDLKADGSLRLTLEFESPSGKLYLECSAQIVRVDKKDGRVGVAARITDSRLERRGSGKQRQGAHV